MESFIAIKMSKNSHMKQLDDSYNHNIKQKKKKKKKITQKNKVWFPV